MGRALRILILSGFGLWLACGEDPGTSGDAIIPSGNPNGKDTGGECAKGFDCKSGVCDGAKCAAPTATDHVRNGSETGIDCGGKEAPLCGGGQPCNVGGDCATGSCESGKCTGPAVPVLAKGDDGIKNGDESDVDCGGTHTNAPRCGTGKTCNAPEDCESKVCSSGTCAQPTATDGVQNGDETDVDCGGTSTKAPPCATGKKCAKHADCESDGCDDQKKCADGRSCTQANGGRTCGEGEVGTPGANHESCCVALPIPGTGTRLDKYKVTAGRMRAFSDRVEGNVRGWYDANKDGLSAQTRATIDAWVDKLPTDVDDMNFHLGGAVFLEDRPSTVQGCFTGSAANPSYGSHTYWTPPVPTLPATDQEDRAFDQAFLDRLPLNCVPYPVMAAFCAWDGGRLQTWEENSAAYGPGLYPWGNAPEAGGFQDVTGTWTQMGPAATRPGGATIAACPGCDVNHMNWLQNYQNPEGGVQAKPWDFAFFISPPGRFPLDKGPGGHMDIGGTYMELTSSPGRDIPGDTAADPKYGAKVRWSRAGSWEGHQSNNENWQFAIMTKYGKTGGRCARD
jgi:hypothetical protein